MSYRVEPIAVQYFEGLHRALDIVARERRYLAFVQAPPFEQSRVFYQQILERDLCQFTALCGEDVVGWCDILPTHGEARAHIGILGIGLIPEARHKGLGARLMEAALAKAAAKGLKRIELLVRSDNTNAKALYERFGFVVEGLQKSAFSVDGQYFDSYSMALVWQ